MYQQQFNEQFTAATRQFADTAARINRLAIENAEQVFGLQLAAIEEGMQTMQRDGLDKAMKGLTTVSEVVRVAYEENGG